MIPVNQVLITKKDALAVYNVVKSGWLSSSGKKVIEFEEKCILIAKINRFKSIF